MKLKRRAEYYHTHFRHFWDTNTPTLILKLNNLQCIHANNFCFMDRYILVAIGMLS